MNLAWFYTEYLYALKKYAVFRGRAPRSEYWSFMLFFKLIKELLDLPCILLGRLELRCPDLLLTASGIYILAMFVPMLAVTARRLHDIGRSGWLSTGWILLFPVFLTAPRVVSLTYKENSEGLTPVLWLLWFVFIVSMIPLAIDSQSGKNKYGPNPKETRADNDSAVNLENQRGWFSYGLRVGVKMFLLWDDNKRGWLSSSLHGTKIFLLLVVVNWLFTSLALRCLLPPLQLINLGGPECYAYESDSSIAAWFIFTVIMLVGFALSAVIRGIFGYNAFLFFYRCGCCYIVWSAFIGLLVSLRLWP